jgi:hypothetical protein
MYLFYVDVPYTKNAWKCHGKRRVCEVHNKKSDCNACNRPWRPIGMWNIQAPTFSRQSTHRWRWGCQPYEPAGRPLPPGRFMVLISIRGWVDPRGHSAAGRIRSVEKSNGLFGNRTRDLPSCSIMTQPTMLSRAPFEAVYLEIKIWVFLIFCISQFVNISSYVKDLISRGTPIFCLLTMYTNLYRCCTFRLWV